ncbi:zinc finger MYND domain-containing protein 11-like isoform X2 [Tubulanus polymorphus]|uniref:zinc finger MYND domain-containing protein 11-like isoform X2 n=1 Tax=Tubulanus polymorphus TaxID=672921 RepID=UPI003DA1D0BC
MGRPAKSTEKRRTCPPLIALQLRKAMVAIRQQRQVPNLERMQRFTGREFGMKPNETESYLKSSEYDKLVIKYSSIGNKGKAGIEQTAFRLPDLETIEADKGSHDWYCFECHRPGDVLKCKDCWRVYHTDCVDDWDPGSPFHCPLCKICQKKAKIPRRELNRLLSYTIQRLKAKTRELHKLWVTDEDKQFFPFLYKLMDLNEMQQRVKRRKYRYLEEFHADARLILHDIMLVHDDPSVLVDLTRMMLKDCTHDLDEIRLCKDCYFMSNAKPHQWFCEPCVLPHELVYAKQKGFSYWPAKVIKVTKDGYDVRFFGGWHQRATVPKSSIKPIDSNPKDLNVKRSDGFVKACDELTYHRELLEKQLDRQLEAQRQGVAAAQRADDDDDDSVGTASEISEDFDDMEELPVSKDVEMEDVGGPERVSDDEEEQRKKEETDGEDDEPPAKRKRRQKRKSIEDTGNEAIASTEKILEKSAPTPEDVHMVTSSEDKVHKSAKTTSTQTNKKVGKTPAKQTQTDCKTVSSAGSSSSSVGAVGGAGCNCDAKYDAIIKNLKKEQKKELALIEQSRIQVKSECEDDASKPATQPDLERVRRMTEEQCRAEYMEQMKKLAQKHKDELSATKKKQWCFNCEDEAMYHCCWNTSYCSIKCQQEHWHKEHKRVCRRKR